MKKSSIQNGSLRHKAITLSLGFALVAVHPAGQAANQTYNSTGASASWSSTTNWNGNAAPGATSGTNSADIATFLTAPVAGAGDTLGNALIIDSGRNISGLTFDTSAGSFFIGSTGGNPLVLSNGGTIRIASTTTGTNLTQTINAPLTLAGGSYTFDNSGAGTTRFIFGGPITNTGAVTLNLQGNQNTTGVNLISGNIIEGTGTLSVNIPSSDKATWELSGGNNYNGDTTMNIASLGTLTFSGTNAGSGQTILNKGTAILNNANGGGIASGAINFVAGGSGATLQNNIANLSLNNVITFARSATITGSNNLTLNGDLTVTVTGQTFNSSITGGSTLTLAGKVNLGASGTSGFATTLGGSGLVNVTGVIQDFSGGVGTVGSGLTIINTGTTTLSNVETYTGPTVTSAGSGTVNLTGTLGATAVTINGGVFNVSNAGALNNITSLSQVGGTINISKPQTYAVATTIGGGTMNLAGFDATVANSDFTVSGVLAINSGSGTPAGSVTRGKSVTLSSGTMTVTGIASPTTTNDQFTNALNIGTGVSTLTITPNAASNAQVTFGSLGTRSAGGILLPAGTIGGTPGVNQGNLFFTGTLSGANFIGGGGANGTSTASLIPWMRAAAGGFFTYDAVKGVTALTGGTNSLTSGSTSNALMTSNQILSADQTVNSLNMNSANGTITMAGRTLTVTSGAIESQLSNTIGVDAATSGTLAFGSQDAVIDVRATRTLAINSVIAGSGGLTAVGFDSGTDPSLVLNGSNTYTGPTNLFGSGGTFQVRVGNSMAFQNTTVNANSGAVLTFGVSGTTTVNSATFGGLGGSAAIALNNVGPGVGAVALTVGGNNESSTYSGVLSGSGSVIKTGSGSLSITGIQQYTGGTTINSGTLTFSGANTNTSGNYALNGGVLRATTSNQALGNSAAITVNMAGGELQLANDTALTEKAAVSVATNATITSDRLTSGAGVTHTTGTLSIGANTLTVASGSAVTSGTQGLTFGSTILSGSSIFNITNPAGATTLLTLGAITDNGNSITLRGNGNFAQGGAWAGTGGLTLDSNFTGTAIMSQANTFSGNVSLQKGTIQLGGATIITSGTIASGPLGLGTIFLGSGTNAAGLQTTVTNATTRTLSNNISLDGDLTFSTTTSSGRIALNALGITGSNQLATPNTITLTRTNTLTGAGTSMTVDMVGQITGTYGLNFGPGAVWNIGNTSTPETAANTYTGLTLITGGTVTLNKTAGTNAIAGNVQIDGGTLQLGGTNENINNTSTVTVNSGGIWATNGRTETIGNLTVGGGVVSGGGSVIVASAGNTTVTSGTVSASSLTTGTSGMTLGSGALVSSTTTLNGNVAFTGATTGATMGTNAITLNGARTFTVASGTSGVDLTVSGAVSDGSGTGSINKLGAGTMSSTGASTYTGGLTLTNGTLRLGANTVVTTGTLISGPIGTGTLTLAGGTLQDDGSNRTLANNVSINASTTFSSAGATGITLNGTSAGATVAINSSNPTLTVNNTLTIFDVIRDGSGNSLAKAGQGSLVLSNSNTFSGGLTVKEGTVSTSNAGGLGAGTVTLGDSATGADARLNSSFNGTIANNINVAGGNGSFATTIAGSASNAGNGNTTYAGLITLSHNTRLDNTAEGLTFSGAIMGTGSGYTLTNIGKSVVFSGTLGTGITSIVQSGSSTSTLAVNSVASSAVNSAFNGNLAVVSGTLTLGNFAVYNPAIVLSINAGAAAINSSGNSATGQLIGGITDGTGGGGTFVPGTNRFIELAGSGNYSFSGNVSTNSGGFIKSGSGLQTLSGSNTATGTLNVAGGTLRLDATGIGTYGVAPVTMKGGTFEYYNNSTSGVRSQTLGALSASVGSSLVQSTLAGSGSSNTLTFGSFSRSAGATVNLITAGGANGITNKIALSGTGFINQGTFFNGSNYAYNDVSGGYVRGIDYGIDAGTSTTSGTTSIATTTYAQTTGAITAQGSSTFTGLQINGSSPADITLGSGAILATSGILRTGGGSTTISGGSSIRAGGLNAELVVRTDTAADSVTISAPITTNGGNRLTKDGAGTLTLTSTANTYTGATNVLGGTLVVSGSINGSAAVSVFDGAILASGNNVTSAMGPVIVSSDHAGGGTLAPGNTGGSLTSSIGKLNVSGTMALGVAGTVGGAHLAIELGGTTAGTSYDQVSTTGLVTLNNVNLDVTFVNSFAGTVADGDVFYVVLTGGAGSSGAFANQSTSLDVNGFYTITVGGRVFDVSYDATAGASFSNGGTDIALMAVPEPNTWAMLLGGLGMLSFWQRSRRRKE